MKCKGQSFIKHSEVGIAFVLTVVRASSRDVVSGCVGRSLVCFYGQAWLADQTNQIYG